MHSVVNLLWIFMHAAAIRFDTTILSHVHIVERFCLCGWEMDLAGCGEWLEEDVTDVVDHHLLVNEGR